MANPYTLSNAQLQYLQQPIRSTYNLYVAFHNPVQILVQSQDIAIDQYGQYTAVPNADLLALGLPPYAPQANLGPNRIGFVNEPLFFDGLRSTQRNNLMVESYSWSCSGSGTVTAVTGGAVTLQSYVLVAGQPVRTGGPNPASGGQCWITWATPGTYTVSLTVTDRFGNHHTGTRQVRIFADRQTTTAGVYGLTSLSGQINGGWTVQFSLGQHSPDLVLPDNLPLGQFQPVTVFCETSFEATPGNWFSAQLGPYGAPVAGQFYDDPRILFDGYVQSATADENTNMDQQSISCQTVDMILQQAGVHNIGYYHATYAARNSSGQPTSLTPYDPSYTGQLVADLTTEDIYRSLLSGYVDVHGAVTGHSNIGQYHDVVIWRDLLPVPSVTGQTWALTYSGLTVNEGTIWDGITALAQNEFASVWCERTGSVCIGPMLNLRGYELTSQPTAYGPQPLSTILNLQTELNGDAVRGARLAYQLFVFGPTPTAQPRDTRSGYVRDLSGLLGPPIAFHLSDMPYYDDPGQPVADPALFPWIQENWPQDLTIRPIEMQIAENYTARAAFYKLIGTLVNGQNVWSGWYPQTVFVPQGQDQLMLTTVPGGAWQVTTDLVLADITIGETSELAWQYVWEMARRAFMDNNKSYTATVTCGLLPFVRLHDLVHLTRQHVADGPRFSRRLFSVEGISFALDPQNGFWQTQLTLSEVTLPRLAPGIITPPFPAPAISGPSTSSGS